MELHNIKAIAEKTRVESGSMKTVEHLEDKVRVDSWNIAN